MSRLLMMSALLISGLLQLSHAQLTEGEARDFARSAELSRHGKAEGTFLEIQRDTQLENLFRPFAGESQMPFIYRTSDEGREEKGNTVVEHLSIHGPIKDVVVVSSVGTVFLMKGTRGRAEFNRLAREYRVQLQSDQQVEKYLDWYLAVSPDGIPLMKLGSPGELKAAAAEEFNQLGSEVAWEGKFRAWWQKHQYEASRVAWAVQSSRTKGGFRIRFYTISAIDRKRPEEGPSILRATVSFSSGGELTTVTLKRVGPRRGRSPTATTR